MLQGASKDEVAGWFDVVGVLDTFEMINDDGDAVTKRSLLTHSSRLYPWVKDHSGNLPHRWELSDDFVGDVDRLELALNSTDIAAEREVLEEIEEKGDSEASSPEIPAQKISPEELEAHKNPDTPELNKALDTVNEIIGITEVIEPSDEEETTTVEAPPEEEAPPSEDQMELDVDDTNLRHIESERLSDKDSTPEPTEPQPEPVPDTYKCEECGDETDEDVAKMSKIRCKRVLCRAHYLQELRGE